MRPTDPPQDVSCPSRPQIVRLRKKTPPPTPYQSSILLLIWIMFEKIINSWCEKCFHTSAFKILIWMLATTTKICSWTKLHSYFESTSSHAKSIYPRTSKLKTYKLISKCRSVPWVRAIFGISSFGRQVVTRSLEGDNFHAPFPGVTMNQQCSEESSEQIFRHLMSTTGWSRSTSSAYQHRITRNINNTFYSSENHP